MIYDFVVTHGLPNGLQQDTWVTVSISFCIHYGISIMYDSVVTHGLPNGLRICGICISVIFVFVIIRWVITHGLRVGYNS